MTLTPELNTALKSLMDTIREMDTLITQHQQMIKDLRSRVHRLESQQGGRL